MEHQYRENGASNTYYNCNQIRAYVEWSPNQSKKYSLSTFPSSNRRNFEDSAEYCSSALTAQAYKMAISMCTNRQLFL